MALRKLLPLESKLTSESCLVLALFLSSLTLPTDAAELKNFKVAHQNCIPVSTLDTRVKEREDAHQVALQRERDELSRVKLELEQLRKEKTAAEIALSEEKRLRVITEERANSVEQRLEELKAKPEQWRKVLEWLDSEMSSKPLLFLIFTLILRPW